MCIFSLPVQCLNIIKTDITYTFWINVQHQTPTHNPNFICISSIILWWFFGMLMHSTNIYSSPKQCATVGATCQQNILPRCLSFILSFSPSLNHECLYFKRRGNTMVLVLALCPLGYQDLFAYECGPARHSPQCGQQRRKDGMAGLRATNSLFVSVAFQQLECSYFPRCHQRLGYQCSDVSPLHQLVLMKAKRQWEEPLLMGWS